MNREQPDAGWYPDPSDASRSRWWDGHRWTAATRPRGRVRQNAPSEAVATGDTGDTGRTLSVDPLRTTSLHELRAVLEGRTGEHQAVRGSSVRDQRPHDVRPNEDWGEGPGATTGGAASATAVRSRSGSDHDPAPSRSGQRRSRPDPFVATGGPARAQPHRSVGRRLLTRTVQAAFVLAAIGGWVVVLGRLVG